MGDINDIKRKVRSLLAVAAPGSGATDAERDTARRMADKLMADNGFSEKDVGLRSGVILPGMEPQDLHPFPFSFGGVRADENVPLTSSTSDSDTFILFGNVRLRI